jgi:hypothetical protein
LFHRQFGEVPIALGRKRGETAKADPDMPPEPVGDATYKENREEEGEHSCEWKSEGMTG